MLYPGELMRFRRAQGPEANPFTVRQTNRSKVARRPGYASLGLHTFATAAPPPAHSSPHPEVRCPQGFTPSLYSRGMLE